MPEIILYTYFRSSCSARLRIALNLKSLKYTPVYINLLKNEQHSPENLARNPSGTVPTLLLLNSPDSASPEEEGGRSAGTVKITQSLPALEYLDEAFPDTLPLLPANPETKALVRSLAAIIACDVQPVTNLRILKRVEAVGGDRAAWSRELIEEGLAAYEAVIAVPGVSGLYSVGDEVTVADVCLVPAVWGAERVGVDVKGRFPVVAGVVGRLEGLEGVRRAHWGRQGDTPVELRVE
ncbi:maleylacetoacetate isomerase MaiA [Aspergillus saccharolyticus JOP 1030-1]|uniref:Maleylacetoacetate isomerase maia n=1 Tax=Aspergillus saccharolyticus JOP 1030-1 TaxID=1450539 RepID=A0A318Z3M4_9EURO|nr:maleylacetoacetate isomerase maia [Aspergillus saccharolyticus JOP 1030-1]PYH41014.1 maleylacetoacetate isomerase maia [Aspergillus saccharolyticus JOP 1030-1]